MGSTADHVLLRDPGEPVARDEATQSFWLQDPDAVLAEYQSEIFPESVDVVIIGSGISGATLALSLLKENPRLSVAMLEARTVCSGATGRNGGHCKPSSYSLLNRVDAQTSREEIAEIIKCIEFENEHVEEIRKLIEERGYECDFSDKGTVDLFLAEDAFEAAKKTFALASELAPDIFQDGRHHVYEQAEAAARYKCPIAKGAIAFPAGSLWPYKLVCGMIKDCMGQGLILHTKTPVKGVLSTESSYKIVQTDRGDIRAKHVAYTTNAYTAHLVSSLIGQIITLRGAMTAQRPGPYFDEHRQSETMSFVHSVGYDYCVQRAQDGYFMLGGGAVLDYSEIGQSDDLQRSYIPHAYLDGLLNQVYAEDRDLHKVVKSWSGIMGFTWDNNPFVGDLTPITGLAETNESKEWISAGFNGAGMVNAFLCAKALAAMIQASLRKEDFTVPKWFPRSYLITKDRISRNKKRLEIALELNSPELILKNAL